MDRTEEDQETGYPFQSETLINKYGREKMKKSAFLFLILAAAVILPGCGGNRLTYYDSLNTLVSQKQFDAAEKMVEDNAGKFYGDKDLLLYYLDHGYIEHLGAQYQKSNKMLAEANRLAKDYFTKSITTEASTFLVSDNMRPYYGEDFEQALTHVFAAMNYVALNQWEDALVEARAVDQYLTVLQTNYGYKNTYKEDAFVRYLMGMIYENGGEDNDAFIEYRKALYTYRDQHKQFGVEIPQDLFNSALTVGTRLQFNSEMDELKKDFPALAAAADQDGRAKNTGEIVVIHYIGLVPHKIDNILEFAFGKAWVYVNMVKTEGEAAESVNTAATAIRAIASDEQVIVAFPKYVPTSYNITSSIVTIGEKSVPTTVVEDVGRIAVKSLDDRLGRIYAKAIARAAIKFAVTRAAQEKISKKADNAVGAFLLSSTVKLATSLTEKADKRCWQVLPDQIRMARLRLPAGTYDLKCDYYDRSGNRTSTEEKTGIQVKSGQKTFVLVQSIN